MKTLRRKTMFRKAIILPLLLVGCGDPATNVTDGSSVADLATPKDAPELGPPIADCVSIPQGQFREITPPELHRDWWCTPDFNPSGCGNPGDSKPGKIATYGAHYLALAPSAPGTVYLGTSSLGFWRSTDCGAHWTQPAGGSSDVDAGRNWTIAVDPNDAQTVYTTAGYGQGGVYKSTNGGTTFTQMLPADIKSVAAFVEKITLDPTNSNHLLVSFHDGCLTSATKATMFPAGVPMNGNLPVGAPVGMANGQPGWGCLAESKDAGATWNLAANALAWAGLDGPGQSMVNGTTWFYASNSDKGIYMTTTAGASPDGTSPGWKQVVSGGTGGSVYVATDGTYYASNGAVLHSTNGTTWDSVAPNIYWDGFNGSTPFVQGGSHLYATVYSWSTPAQYLVSDVSPIKFVPLADASPVPNGGAHLEFDTHYGLLYSSNMQGGIWLVKP